MQKTSFCEREISKISNLIFVVINTRCLSFASIIFVIYWSYLDKHFSFICRFIFKIKRLKMNKFIRSSSRSFSKAKTLTSFRFMNSNSSSRVFHLFNFLAAHLNAFFSFDVFSFFNFSSSFERFVSSSSLSSLSYSSRSFTARSFTARSFIDRFISSSSLNSSSLSSSSISSRSFTSKSFNDVEISIFRRVNRDSFIIE